MLKRLRAQYAPLRQFVVFAAIGVVCLGLQMCLTDRMVAYAVPAWVANVVAFLLSAVGNYALQRWFNFKKINKTWLAGLVGFLGASTVALTVNETAFMLFHVSLSWDLFAAQAVAGICSTGVSFTLNKLFFLKPHSNPQTQTVEA